MNNIILILFTIAEPIIKKSTMCYILLSVMLKNILDIKCGYNLIGHGWWPLDCSSHIERADACDKIQYLQMINFWIITHLRFTRGHLGVDFSIMLLYLIYCLKYSRCLSEYLSVEMTFCDSRFCLYCFSGHCMVQGNLKVFWFNICHNCNDLQMSFDVKIGLKFC